MKEDHFDEMLSSDTTNQHGDICYQRVPSNISVQDDTLTLQCRSPKRVLWNFCTMSILLSLNHGTLVSCLAFSTLQLGSIGAWQSSLFHVVYATFSLVGIPHLVKQLGPRYSLMLGMACFGIYVGCFALAVRSLNWAKLASLVGAIGGGIGGALVWTAQGCYFGRASREYADAIHSMQQLQEDPRQQQWQVESISNNNSEVQQEARTNATSFLGGLFAFIYLALEVCTKLISWSLLSSPKVSWNTVLSIYTVVAILSTCGMVTVRDYPSRSSEDDSSCVACEPSSTCHKMTKAWHLLIQDSKMRYMIGLNSAFGFAAPFVNSYVNGQVVHLVLRHDRNVHNVGLLSAVTSAVGAVCSLLFGNLSKRIGKGLFLILGSLAFGFTALPFLVWPYVQLQWGWKMLLCVYMFQGIGRASFEGTLRATFADYFVGQEEAAFANITVQSGVFSALGFFLSYGISCHESSAFCVRYKEGTLHDVLTLELMVVTSAIVAVLGIWRASVFFQEEQLVQAEEEHAERGAFIKQPLDRPATCNGTQNL